MTKFLAVITLLLFLGNLQLSIQQLLAIQDESDVDAVLDGIIGNIVAKLSVDRVPEYAKEDAEDIINELRDDLLECKKNLRITQSTLEFKICLHRNIENAEDKIWDFQRSLYSSSSSLIVSSVAILILSKFISTLF